MMPTPVRVVLTYRRPRPEIQGAMWAIYRDFFCHDRAGFLARFNADTHFALYYTRGQLVGFTGLRLDLDKVADRKVFLIHFGQTLILPDFHHRGLIARTAAQLMWRYRKILLRYPSYAWGHSSVPSRYLLFADAEVPHPVSEAGIRQAAICRHLETKYYERPAPGGTVAVADLGPTPKDDDRGGPTDRSTGGDPASPSQKKGILIASLRYRNLLGAARRSLRQWLRRILSSTAVPFAGPGSTASSEVGLVPNH